MKMNNPLPILSAKVLSIGFDVNVEHADGTVKLCVSAEAVAWTWCKEWRIK